MKLNKALIKKISDLAHLEFDGESLNMIQKDMHDMLNYINKIKEIDTQNIQPLINPIEEESELREDKAKESIKKTDLLKNAPDKNSDYFKVPKFIKK